MKIYGSLALLLTIVTFSFTIERSKKYEIGSKNSESTRMQNKVGAPKEERPTHQSPFTTHPITLVSIFQTLKEYENPVRQTVVLSS